MSRTDVVLRTRHVITHSRYMKLFKEEAFYFKASMQSVYKYYVIKKAISTHLVKSRKLLLLLISREPLEGKALYSVMPLIQFQENRCTVLCITENIRYYRKKSFQFPKFLFVNLWKQFLSIGVLNCRAFLFDIVAFGELLVMLFFV